MKGSSNNQANSLQVALLIQVFFWFLDIFAAKLHSGSEYLEDLECLKSLNPSQESAVRRAASYNNSGFVSIHGPPGTGYLVAKESHSFIFFFRGAFFFFSGWKPPQRLWGQTTPRTTKILRFWGWCSKKHRFFRCGVFFLLIFLGVKIWRCSRSHSYLANG